MAYSFTVKDNQVLFSNDEVKELVLYELEFITDAPVLCRKLREEAKKQSDPLRLMHRAKKDEIRRSVDQLEVPATFTLRFRCLEDFDRDLSLQIIIRAW